MEIPYFSQRTGQGPVRQKLPSNGFTESNLNNFLWNKKKAYFA